MTCPQTGVRPPKGSDETVDVDSLPVQRVAGPGIDALQLGRVEHPSTLFQLNADGCGRKSVGLEARVAVGEQWAHGPEEAPRVDAFVGSGNRGVPRRVDASVRVGPELRVRLPESVGCVARRRAKHGDLPGAQASCANPDWLVRERSERIRLQPGIGKRVSPGDERQHHLQQRTQLQEPAPTYPRKSRVSSRASWASERR